MAAVLSGGGAKRFIPLVLALVLGGGAIFLMNETLNQEKLKYRQEFDRLTADLQTPAEVLVLKKDVEQGTMIELAHLEFANVPEKFVQPYSLRAVGDAVGMVAIAPLSAGEQLMASKLRRPEAVPAAATLSSLTPKGQRAVTIGVDTLTGVGGFVRPADTVDVLWSVPLPEEQGGNVTLTLFQHIKVLAVGSQMLGKMTTDQEASQSYTVTLSLTPEQTAVLLYARAQGVVQLSLRAFADKGEQLPVAPMNYVTVLQSVLGMEPPPEPSGPQRTVEVYRGLERTVVSLNE